jgi:hypothetical protein
MDKWIKRAEELHDGATFGALFDFLTEVANWKPSPRRKCGPNCDLCGVYGGMKSYEQP